MRTVTTLLCSPRGSTGKARFRAAAAAPRLASWLFVSLVILVVTTIPASADFTIRPYIQNPGTTQMTVMWESDSLDEAAVTIRRDGETPRVITAPQPVTATHSEDPANPESPRYTRHVYSVKLTGLLPGTKYTYSVKSGEEVSTPSFFRTFPEQADAFTFIAYGDSRTHADIHKQVAANFAQYQPAFILHSGDFVGSGQRHDQWVAEFFEPLADVINHIPLYGARGNHDGRANMDLYLSPPDGSFGYSFDYGTAHFICLDMSAEPEDIAWADKDLATTQALWRFAFYHYPNFNVGGHSSAWGRETVVPMFRKHKVDIAISGHSHLYERFYPLVPHADPTAHPITYIVSGGGGAPKYGTGPQPFLAKALSISHFLVVRVDGDRVTVEARDKDNALFDSFTVTKKDGKYDQAYLDSVMPEEVVSQRQTIARGLRIEIPELPSADRAVDVTFSFSDEAMGLPAEMTVSLADESQPAYTMEPAVWKLDTAAGQKSTATFRLRCRKQVGFDTHGTLGPVLAFVCRYKLGGIEGEEVKSIDWQPLLNGIEGWQPLGEPAPANRVWSYLSFDPREEDAMHPREKKRFRMVALPEGLEEWYLPGFDAKGWQTGQAPIGKGLFKRRETVFANRSDWGEGEFLLMRTTFRLQDTDYDFVRVRALAKQGFRIFLNGHEVNSYVWWKDEPEYRPILLAPTYAQYLVKGANVIAVYCNVEYRKDETIGQADFFFEGLKVQDQTQHR